MKSSYRTAGHAAIASGIVGILAYVFLIGFLVIRDQDSPNANLPIRVHDACVIVQLLLLIPVVITLSGLTRDRTAVKPNVLVGVSVGSLCATILFLLLIFPKILTDTLYMFPQGIFGISLIITCWHLAKAIPQWLRWFGMIVGFGLTLVGVFPVGFALFVDSVILHIPAPSDAVIDQIPADTTANTIIHFFLYIGTFLGVLTLPIWTILTGVRLLRRNSRHQP